MQLQRFTARVTAVEKMATPMLKAKRVIWFNKTSATTPSGGIWNLSTF
jgi:hypothetical protein